MNTSSPLLGSLVIVLAGGFAACSGGSGDGGNRADGGGVGVLDGGAGRDGGSAICAEVSDFGDLGFIDGQVFGDAVEYLSIDTVLDTGDFVDLFVVELFAGLAPFEGGLTTGTFEITGALADYEACGACVGVFANISDGQTAEMVYTAQSGTLVITSVDGDFAGSFTPDGATSTMVGFSDDGAGFVRQAECTVEGGGASWDQAIPAT